MPVDGRWASNRVSLSRNRWVSDNLKDYYLEVILNFDIVIALESGVQRYLLDTNISRLFGL
jgi:hypothetical protein